MEALPLVVITDQSVDPRVIMHHEPRAIQAEQYRAPGDMPRELAQADAEAWVDASTACVDYVAVAAQTYSNEIEVFDEAGFRECVHAHIDERGA